jgi:signal transduction histidine kinase
MGYAALFASSALIVLVFVYLSATSYMASQADETIEAEIAGLSERYRLTGLSGLTSSIRERLNRRPAGNSVYLLTDQGYNPIVGNLSPWPQVESDENGWMSFDIAVGDGEPLHPARAKRFQLRGGFHLLVGRDLSELQAVGSLLKRTMFWGVALTLCLALLGGLVTSRSRLRRIAAINEGIDQVMTGDLSRRIPAGHSGDDVDELVERINAMLDELDKLVEGVHRVSDNIAHDLRTPLARLKTRLERARSLAPDNDELREAIDEVDKLLATFGALLRISRIESGERRAKFESVDLTALIDDVAELYAPLIEDATVKLVVHNAPGVSVLGDRDMLFQAVSNLVDNALKYASRGGRIEISTVPNGEGVRIDVADQGPGIPVEEREHVRERFYRLDRSRATPGAGLGLSLVSAVVELHHGQLALDDNHPGLRVVLTLPRPHRA